MGRLDGKTAVVTGTTAGMGKAIAERFVWEGANVIAVARRVERLHVLKESLADAPGKLSIFVGDISCRETNEKMIEKAVEEFGSLDILVNNAGIMDNRTPIGELTDEEYDRLMMVNAYGPMCAMRKAIQVMREQGKGGSIVNISSIGGYRLNSSGVAYVASKAAVIAMTKNTAVMYAREGIRCNSVAPGGIATEIGSTITDPNPHGEAVCRRLYGCMNGVGQPEDIANAVLFLASDESKFINGDVLLVDGAWGAI